MELFNTEVAIRSLGPLLAGLSISAPADRLDEEWLAKLQATAEQISTSLGHKSDQA